MDLVSAADAGHKFLLNGGKILLRQKVPWLIGVEQRSSDDGCESVKACKALAEQPAVCRSDITVSGCFPFEVGCVHE